MPKLKPPFVQKYKCCGKECEKRLEKKDLIELEWRKRNKKGEKSWACKECYDELSKVAYKKGE